ncbi:hypothetical protein V1523DRAFT_406853 [Lipomyces doorenjongii]
MSARLRVSRPRLSRREPLFALTIISEHVLFTLQGSCVMDRGLRIGRDIYILLIGWLGMTWLYAAEVVSLVNTRQRALSTAANWIFNSWPS